MLTLLDKDALNVLIRPAERQLIQGSAPFWFCPEFFDVAQARHAGQGNDLGVDGDILAVNADALLARDNPGAARATGLESGEDDGVAPVLGQCLQVVQHATAGPVGAPDTCAALRQQADDVICAATPEPFRAVGLWYQKFPQATDNEVCALLEQARREHAAATRLSGHTEEKDSL